MADESKAERDHVTRTESAPRASGAAGLRAAAEARARRKAEGLPEPERLDPLEKAKRNPTSLRLAIDAKCFDCQGRDADPGVRWRIGNCASTICPLVAVRPYQHLAGKPRTLAS